jgi:hypothetical protein
VSADNPLGAFYDVHGRSFRERPGQEYPKPANVYEEFDDSKKRKVCVRIVASGKK